MAVCSTSAFFFVTSGLPLSNCLSIWRARLTTLSGMAQEGDVLAALLDRDGIILDALKGIFQLSQFVVMGGKKCLRAQLLLVGNVLQHRAGDAHAVEGGGTAPDFVQHQNHRRLPRG